MVFCPGVSTSAADNEARPTRAAELRALQPFPGAERLPYELERAHACTCRRPYCRGEVVPAPWFQLQQAAAHVGAVTVPAQRVLSHVAEGTKQRLHVSGPLTCRHDLLDPAPPLRIRMSYVHHDETEIHEVRHRRRASDPVRESVHQLIDGVLVLGPVVRSTPHGFRLRRRSVTAGPKESVGEGGSRLLPFEQLRLRNGAVHQPLRDLGLVEELRVSGAHRGGKVPVPPGPVRHGRTLHARPLGDLSSGDKTDLFVVRQLHVDSWFVWPVELSM